VYPTILVRHRPQLLHDWFLFSMVAIAIFLDRVTKGLIQTNFELGQSLPEEGLIRLTYITNSGGAFGMFPNQTYLLTLASFGGIGVLWLFYRTLPRLGRMVRLSLGLQLGGAIGNLIDRLWAGEVVDFIDIGIWPIFNLADSFIVVGIFLLLGIFLLEERRDAKLMTSNGSISCRRPPAEVGC
jgi:signal peptidase II